MKSVGFFPEAEQEMNEVTNIGKRVLASLRKQGVLHLL